jgi:hypothetical protein
MKKHIFWIVVAAIIGLNAQIAFADVAITIYNQNLALVRETRDFDFNKGVGEIRFIDVAAQIIPTSVHFSSDKVALLEQDYEYDLVDAQKLLNKYVDRQVELETESKEFFSGKLLSAAGDAVVAEKDGSIRSISRTWIVNVHFPDLPEGLITRPTLVWTVDSKNGGKGSADVSYLTNGMQWESEYVAVTDKDDANLSLTGWVNITNNSGATYKDARIKLMAGDVNIERAHIMGGRAGRAIPLAVDESEMAPQFQEQAFYEYHLYTLQRTSTLSDNQVKQISLFPTASTPVKKEYRLANDNNKKVKVTLEFVNSEKAGLGMPLPKGKVRVYKEGPDGGLEFVGEDRIDHTPKDEKVRVSTGNAFDITGERTQTDHKDQKGGTQETWVAKLRNHKKESVEVIVPASFWGDWELQDGTTPGWDKKNANLVEWKVTLKPDEEKSVNYVVFRKNR